ncbi:MAG: 50S ribosomal protein L10 [Chloroflexi bacterium]|nr:MAG: 50S ribosomal protein L10 [Chloroflexota bacterium]
MYGLRLRRPSHKRVAFLVLANKGLCEGGRVLAISRQRKEELVAQYTQFLENADGFVVVSTTGMTVPQVEALRAKIREAQGQYVRTKNTLFRIALQQAGWTVPEELLNGPTSVAFSEGNFPGVAKVILDFITDKANAVEDKAQVTGGVMGEEVLNSKQVETYSKLPTLDELRSQIAGLVVQPATGLVGVLNAATSQIVNVLHAYVQEKGDGEAA